MKIIKKMKGKKNSKTMEMLLKTCLEIQKQLQLTRNIEGTFQLVFYFIVNLITATQTHNLVSWFRNNLHTYSVSLCLILTIKPFTLLIIAMVYLWQKNKESKQNPTKIYLFSQFKTLFIFLLRRKEFIIFPVKYLIYLCFFLDPELREKTLTSTLSITLLMAWMILDIISSALLTQIKVSYLRSFTPEIDYFTKFDGYFEQILLLFMLLGTSISAWGLTKFQGQSGTLMALTIFALLSFLIIGFFYFKELPYLHRMTEKVMCLLLINFIGLYFFYSILNNYNLLRGLITYSIFSPVVILLCLRVINQQYNSDYLKKDKVGKFKYIKKIYVNNHNYSSYKEVIEDYGIIKKHLISSKSEKRYLEVWKLMTKMKNIESLEKKNKFVQNEKNTFNKFNTTDLSKKTLNFEIESTNHKYKLIFHKMDSLVFDKYIKERNNNPFMILLKIVWMMRNDIRLSLVFSCLRLMKLKSKTFKEKFFYEYAKTEISHILKGIYFQENLYFDNIELTERKKNINIKDDLKKISKQGIDLCYGLYYKDKIENIVYLVTQFIDMNKKFFDNVKSEIKNLKSIHQKIKYLHGLDREISEEFHKLHLCSDQNHFWHFAPYYYYLSNCVSMHRSAQKIYQEYKKRVLFKKRLIEKNDSFFTKRNFFENMMIFLLESEKKNFGKILDTFGKAEYLRTTHKLLKGKHMDTLIMDSHIRAHTTACEKFMNQPLCGVIGDMRETFIKIPSTDYVLPVTFKRKIVPFSHKEFNFVIGTKFIKLNSKMYLLLDQNGQIDSFSDNMRYLFRNPKEYLNKKEMKISQICPTLWAKMNNSYKNITSLGEEKNGKLEKESLLTPKNDKKTQQNIEKLKGKEKVIYKSTKESNSLIFKFRNLKNGKIVHKRFNVDFRIKNYKRENFCYYVVCLTLDEELNHRQWSIKPIKLTKENFTNTIENRKIKIDENEKSGNFFRKITEEGVNVNFVNTSKFKFLKDINSTDKKVKNMKTGNYEEERKKILIQVNEVNEMFFGSEDDIESLNGSQKDEENKICENELNEEKTQGVLDQDEIRINSPDIEEKALRKESKYEEGEEEGIESMRSMSLNKKKQKEESTIKSKIFSKKTSNFYTKKKILLFEDIVEKKAKKLIIAGLQVIFLISSFSLVSFSYYITYILQEQNEESSFDTKTIKEIIKFENNLLIFNNWLLRQASISEGLIHQDR